jgi:sigma-B regulation protein RsbU (phosphoserine phosphatase)
MSTFWRVTNALMSTPRLIYTNPDGPQTVALESQSVSIGRAQDQDVVLQDRCVSRHHAAVVREGDSWFFIDENSSHGSFLHGARIQRVQLKHGDELYLGASDGARIRVEFASKEHAEWDTKSNSVSDLLSSMAEFSTPDARNRPRGREIEQLNWLLAAARQLNAGGAIKDVLNSLLQLTLQLTGVERGFVFLREGQQMTFARGLNSNGESVNEDSTVSRKAIQKAIASESKFSVSDTTADIDASAWASVVINNIRSIYCIPLRKRETNSQHSELLGVLYLDSQIGAGSLSEIDHQLLDTIATEASTLLHNALLGEIEFKSRKAREELAVAARIHSGLMPAALPVLPYARIQAKTVPCLEIGGDFYDAIVLKDCVCVSIADVSGKGLPAAIVAATLQGIIHAQFLSGQGLAAIAALVNQFLCSRNVGKYATMVLLKLYPTGMLEYINCGHVGPILMRDGQAQQLLESNLVVGLIAGAEYASATCQLQLNDRILLATDGLVEAENTAGEAFGEAGLSAVAHNEDLNVILNHVARFHAPNEAQDDCTLAEVLFTGEPS